MSNIQIKNALKLAQENYSEYARYVSSGRAFPSIIDGAKSSYKRAIYGMWKNSPRSIVKVAELAAAALPYHPHPTSVSGVIVQLGENGNNLKLMKTQGNWGDSSKNIQPAADRYIGGMLSDTALELTCDAMDYCNYIKGEIDKDEPEALPTLIPLCFINGQSGIPTGLPKVDIPPLNLAEMFDYYIDILKHKDINYQPKKLPSLNVDLDILSSKEEWENILKTGKGSVKVAPRINMMPNGVIEITSLPHGKNAESVYKIIEKEILADKVDLLDGSGKDTYITVEKVYKKQCDMSELFTRIYKKLQTTYSYNMAFFDLESIYVPCSFNAVVKRNLQYLIDTHQKKLAAQLKQLESRISILKVIDAIKRAGTIKELVELSQAEALIYLQRTYGCDEDTANKVLQKPISYLTKEHNQEIVDLQEELDGVNIAKSDIYEYLAKKYADLKKKVVKEARIYPVVYKKG